MNATSIRFLAVVTVAFSLAVTIAYAQDKTTISGAGEVKSILLRPGGWAGEYRGPNGDGLIEFVFEERGEKIMAKITSHSINMKCEREVQIVDGAVKMDACYSKGITLRYDPNDSKYPFKGENETVAYKLTPK